MSNIAIPFRSVRLWKDNVNAGGQFESPSGQKRPGLLVACGVLALVMLIALPIFIWWGRSQHGASGIQAALVAVGVCWICATVALVVTGLFTGTSLALQATLGSVFLRTMAPLAIGIFLDQQVPVLAQAGVFGMMVPAYLVSLAAETLLAFWLATPHRTVAKAA